MVRVWVEGSVLGGVWVQGVVLRVCQLSAGKSVRDARHGVTRHAQALQSLGFGA